MSWDRRDNPASPTRGTPHLQPRRGDAQPALGLHLLRMQFGSARVRAHPPRAHPRPPRRLRRHRRVERLPRGRPALGVAVPPSCASTRRHPVQPRLPLNRVGVPAPPPSAPVVERRRPRPDDPNKVVAVGGTAMGGLGRAALAARGLRRGALPRRQQRHRHRPDALPLPVGVNGPPPSASASRPPTTSSPTTTPACARTRRLTAAPPRSPLAPSPCCRVPPRDAFVQSVHPSVGIGLRYATPAGPVRPTSAPPPPTIGCTSPSATSTPQTNAVARSTPTTPPRPRCDLLGF